MILLTSNNYDDQLDDHSSRKRNYDSFASPSMGKLSIQTENRLPLSSQQKKINKDKDTFSVPVFQPLQVIKNRKEKCKVSQYAGYSLRGYSPSNLTKPNQDAIVMMEDPNTGSIVHICLDGHGVNGEKISRFVKNELEKKLFAHPDFNSDMRGAIVEVVKGIQEDLLKFYSEVADYSGTTMAMAVVRGSKILIANVGDSRVLLASRQKIVDDAMYSGEDENKSSDTVSVGSIEKDDSFGWKVVGSSIDHKPDLPDEYYRITDCGGRVFSMRYSDGAVGPPRVWLKTANVPGLAMSRSLGDNVVHTVGVIANPEFTEYSLQDDSDYMLITATDGLWDWMANEDVLAIASSYGNPTDTLYHLLTVAQKRWLEKEKQIDDISVTVVHLFERS